MEGTVVSQQVEALQTKITTLEELLSVQEIIVGDQASNLDAAMRQLDERIIELEKTKAHLQLYADELSQANEEVKQFAYIVSHDLRAPLINLKGFGTELRVSFERLAPIIEKIAPSLSEDEQTAVREAVKEDIPEALEFIQSSASRMDGFISALLQLSRMGRRDLSPEPLDVTSIVREVVDGLQHQIDTHGISVAMDQLPPVTADRTAVEQMFGNILSNAVKYIDPARPCRIEIAGACDGTEAVYTIKDSGRGIAAEDMHKVFAPFRRAGAADVPGEGMGLAYVRTMVRRHGGRIDCESELGAGTTFTVVLPVAFHEGVTNAAM